MKSLNVETKSNIYPIYIADSFDYLRKAFIDASLDGNKAVLIILLLFMRTKLKA